MNYLTLVHYSLKTMNTLDVQACNASLGLLLRLRKLYTSYDQATSSRAFFFNKTDFSMIYFKTFIVLSCAWGLILFNDSVCFDAFKDGNLFSTSEVSCFMKFKL